MPALLTRALALVGLLVVPLTLALASQALAQRPGPPEVDPAPVQLDRTAAPEEPRPSSRPSPGATPPAAPPTATPTATPTAPRTVSPSLPAVEGDDDADEPDDAGDDGD